MPDIVRTIAFGGAAAALLAACASSSSAEEEMANWQEDARLGEKVDRICFSDSIDSFRMATRDAVIVRKGVNREYLVEMVGQCPDLDNANSLNFDTSPGSSCVTRGDKIYAHDSGFGVDRSGVAQLRCPIRAIYEWNEDALDDEAGMNVEE